MGSVSGARKRKQKALKPDFVDALEGAGWDPAEVLQVHSRWKKKFLGELFPGRTRFSFEEDRLGTFGASIWMFVGRVRIPQADLNDLKKTSRGLNEAVTQYVRMRDPVSLSEALKLASRINDTYKRHAMVQRPVVITERGLERSRNWLHGIYSGKVDWKSITREMMDETDKHGFGREVVSESKTHDKLPIAELLNDAKNRLERSDFFIGDPSSFHMVYNLLTVAKHIKQRLEEKRERLSKSA